MLCIDNFHLLGSVDLSRVPQTIVFLCDCSTLVAWRCLDPAAELRSSQQCALSAYVDSFGYILVLSIDQIVY